MVKDPQNKYIPFVPLKMTQRSWPDNQLTHPPIWCSVDLRDGNQALVDPMNVEEKLELFHTLVDIGVKEIEVGFPSASETEFEFLRALIDGGHIPDDVTIQVLVQAREHLIRRTFEAIDGAKHVIFHFYNSTSTLQRKVVFHTGVDGVKQIAVDAANLIRELSQSALDSGMDLRYEYSPESFMGTEMDAAVEICQAVLEALQATPERKVILNLPTTVENCMPNYFADEIEYFISKLPSRDCAIISLHPHNDRGEGVATAELGQLAGAERVEATLFGNGERTGNVDMVTLALNLYTQGVDPGLDFSDINKIRDVYERVTKMKIGERQPYVGELVFTAFSGSHQDAIAKGMAWREEKKCDKWTVPYLPIDPQDVGRRYDSDVIRINSQSGKGGVNYILKQSHGINLPEKMREEVGYLVKGVSDKAHKELTPEWVYQIFTDNYVNAKTVFSIDECHFRQADGIIADATIHHGNDEQVVTASGNGRLDAVSNAIKQYFNISYELRYYEEHSLTRGSSSKAVAYVGIISHEKTFWGVGIDADIIRASIEALIVAVNKIEELSTADPVKDARMIEIMNYIQANYIDVTLDDLAEKFYLSKPYLSKYIREKSGMTFGDLVKKIRMKKARALLKSSNMTVENIALSVGYQNVEHFNRLFKKAYNMTPVQFRNQK